jgi:hypothetical protein
LRLGSHFPKCEPHAYQTTASHSFADHLSVTHLSASHSRGDQKLCVPHASISSCKVPQQDCLRSSHLRNNHLRDSRLAGGLTEQEGALSYWSKLRRTETPRHALTASLVTDCLIEHRSGKRPQAKKSHRRDPSGESLGRSIWKETSQRPSLNRASRSPILLSRRMMLFRQASIFVIARTFLPFSLLAGQNMKLMFLFRAGLLRGSRRPAARERRGLARLRQCGLQRQRVLRSIMCLAGTCLRLHPDGKANALEGADALRDADLPGRAGLAERTSCAMSGMT